MSSCSLTANNSAAYKLNLQCGRTTTRDRQGLDNIFDDTCPGLFTQVRAPTFVSTTCELMTISVYEPSSPDALKLVTALLYL